MVDFLESRLDADLYKKKRKKKIKTIAFIVAIVVCVLFLRGLYKVIRQPKTLSEVIEYESKININTTPGIFGYIKKFIIDPEHMLKGEASDNINILILGIGGAGHDGPFLTDTILLANAHPTEGSVYLLSIPRDLGYEINKQEGIKRINYVNAYGEVKEPGKGAEYSKDAIEKITGQTVDYYIRIDFKAFEEIINDLGGIDIDVEKSFIDQSFPVEGSSEYKTVEFVKGVQHLTGAKALEYARSRHGSNGENSDYARTRRQQKILLAIRDKGLSFGTLANPAKLKRIMDTLKTNISTNIDLWSAIRFIKLAGIINKDKILGAVIDSSPDGLLVEKNIGGAFILEPKTQNYNDIQKFVEEFFSGINKGLPQKINTVENGSVASSSPTIYIQNGTWRAGLAAKWKQKFEEKGFVVIGLGNSVERPVKTTIIIVRKNSNEINASANIIKNEIGGTGTINFVAAEVLDDSHTTIPYSDIVVIIGDDAAL